MGVWVADAAGNVSTLDESSMPFVNRLGDSQVLADGQRIQYRGYLGEGMIALTFMKTVSGDPDLYVWQPRNSFWPDRSANHTVAPGYSKELGSRAEKGAGRYLLEVQAVGASEYELSFPGRQSVPVASAASATATRPRPQHPLTVSDPLSGGQAGLEFSLPTRTYLPWMFRSN